MRTVARIEPRGMPSASWAWMKTSFQSRASWCDSSLAQVEVRPAPRRERLGAVVEQVQPEVEQRWPRPARRRRASPDSTRCQPRGRTTSVARLVVQAVGLALGRVEGERAADRVGERRLAADDVGPGRRQRVLEVGHEDAGARVEGVDHHLGLGRPGDLDPPVVEVGRRRGDGPVGLADVAASPTRKSGRAPGIELGLALLRGAAGGRAAAARTGAGGRRRTRARRAVRTRSDAGDGRAGARRRRADRPSSALAAAHGRLDEAVRLGRRRCRPRGRSRARTATGRPASGGGSAAPSGPPRPRRGARGSPWP